MKTDFDVVIVGSGPAGVSAAYPLVEAGLQVLMVDSGSKPQGPSPTNDFITERLNSHDQWKWFIGQDFHALRHIDATSPKLRVPKYKPVFENFAAANRIVSNNFTVVGSLATGGLSQAWGAGVARLTGPELSKYPFALNTLNDSYQIVAKRMGVSGSIPDDLSDYFCLDEWASPPIALDTLHQHLADKYHARRSELISSGIKFGRSRVAVLNQDSGERQHCDNLGNCLWGCQRQSIYSAEFDLAGLSKFKNFHFQTETLIEKIRLIEGVPHILGKRKNTVVQVGAKKVLLAAGTLSTTRLALDALGLYRPVNVLSCPTAAFLLWLPKKLGNPTNSHFGLGQLSYAISINPSITGFGSTFSLSGIPITELSRHLPMKRRFGLQVLTNLVSSCLVGNLFLPSGLSNVSAFLNNDGSLTIKGGELQNINEIMSIALPQLRSAYWKLGAWLLPSSFTIGKQGGDIHYAGTLPMRAKPKAGETKANGELTQLPGVIVVDGACLPTLSEKSHTLTIMANADRISRELINNDLSIKKVNH